MTERFTGPRNVCVFSERDEMFEFVYACDDLPAVCEGGASGTTVYQTAEQKHFHLIKFWIHLDKGKCEGFSVSLFV